VNLRHSSVKHRKTEENVVMSTLNLGGRSLATLYPSLWLCDVKGDVYVLKNLEQYSDSYVSRLQSQSFVTEEKPPDLQDLESPTPPLTPSPEWVKVGNGFSSVAAGFEGLVCGIYSSSLYIRMGVRHDKPEGKRWTQIICNATRVAVGKDCIARKTSQGDLHIVNIRDQYNNCNVSSIQNWTHINVHHLREMQQQEANGLSLEDITTDEHLLLDDRDRLFVVAPSGVVYCCLDPYSNDCGDAQWNTVIPAPPINNRISHFMRSLYSYVRGRNESIFSQVCVGKGALWCVRADNSDIWQLVVSDFKTSGGVAELRANWSSVSIPAQDERLSLLAASKSAVDGVYAVMVKNSNGRGVIVSHSLNQVGSGRVEIELPSQHNPVCLVVALTLHSAPAACYAPTPSLRGRQISDDICCENGECSFCQQRQQEPDILTRSMFASPPTDYRMDVEEQRQQGLPGPASILGKRPRQESLNGSLNEYHQLSIARGHGSGSSSVAMEEHGTKRRRHSDRYCPLEGVQFQRDPHYYPNVCKVQVCLLYYNMTT
jgi:hypothetical protein